VGGLSVAKPRRRGTTFATTAAVVAIVAVLFVIFLVKLVSSGSVKSQLGSSTWLAGYTSSYAPLIASGGPLLEPDLVGGKRPLYLQHLGMGLKQGWYAIQATVPGEPDHCVVTWSKVDISFHDLCSGKTYPADGTGLVRFKTTILPSNRIEVDLRSTLG
jgi:hypothetical protein